MRNDRAESKFQKISPFPSKLWLSSPTMHGEEQAFVKEAFDTNWVSTVGKNISEAERLAAEFVGCRYAVALSSGTAALHMAIKLAAERVYGSATGVSTPDGAGCGGALYAKHVFCSDLTFAATISPIVYEGGIPVLVDSEYDTWNMAPAALKRAFARYPDVKIVMVVNLYGTPAKLDELREICDSHGAVLIEDAAESLGARYRGVQTGRYGTIANVISYNGNKIITGSSGGMLLTDDEDAAKKVRKWSTQSRENAPWYQHEELGYNYRMSNVIAGIVRGQYPHLPEHVAKKKAIYQRYQEGFRDLPVTMNPYVKDIMEPNFWLSCILIEKDAMCRQVRGEKDALYVSERGKSCPMEILEKLNDINAEGRPIWKPMHLQPIYRTNPFVTADDSGEGDAGADIFARGLCLPSDIKMTEAAQDAVIEVVRGCFE